MSEVSPFHLAPKPSTSKEKEREMNEDSEDEEADAQPSGPSWKGAWSRRQAARAEASRKKGKIPVPQIPDLRFEQGVMASIRPFIHRVGGPTVAYPESVSFTLLSSPLGVSLTPRCS